MAFTNLALAMYPVGSLYFSSLPASPAGVFGGTWTQLDDNKFLRPSNSFGQTGGSDTHAHNFNLSAAFDSNHEYLTWKYSASRTWYPNWRLPAVRSGENISDEAHNNSTDIFGEIYSADNIPAYRTVYCWYRVS